MNILFVLTRYPGIGGIERVTQTITESLIQRGFSLDVLSFFQASRMNLHNVRLYKMPEEKYDSPFNKAYLEKILKEGKYDVLIFQDSYAPTERCVIGAAKLCQVPVITFEHNTPLFVENKRKLEKWCKPMGLARRLLHPWLMHRERKRKRYLLENSFRYVVLSDAFINDFCDVIGIDEVDHRLRVVHNPAIPCDFPSMDNKENVILCVAQLNSVKRVDLMLKAWKHICYNLPDWCFWIVGDGEERSKLEKIVKAMDLQRVSFFGFQKPAPYYEKAKIFWMTSKYEGWGITLVEAMQRGCIPVAMNTYSSLKDIVDDGVNGIICNEDLQSLCDATLLLANDDELYQKLVINAREKTRIWDINNVMQEWSSLLNELAVK